MSGVDVRVEHVSRRDKPHELIVCEEDCGCVRLRCTWGHSPEEILAGLDRGLTLDDLLCEEHRRSRGASS